MGLKCLGLAAVSNPATGTIEGWVHEQEFYIRSAKLCLLTLKNIIWKVVERFELNPEHKQEISFIGVNSLSLKQLDISPMQREVYVQALKAKLLHYTEGRACHIAWCMSEAIYHALPEQGVSYIVSLKDVVQLRSRSALAC